VREVRDNKTMADPEGCEGREGREPEGWRVF
jgi:hypothetical protein